MTCPRCLTATSVRLDLDDGETLTCPDCEETFTVGNIQSIIESWTRVLPWLLTHPGRAVATEEEDK